LPACLLFLESLFALLVATKVLGFFIDADITTSDEAAATERRKLHAGAAISPESVVSFSIGDLLAICPIH
jgi:hypothetical protein